MKLSDLPKATGAAPIGSMRVEVTTFWPPGIAGIFADGVVVVNSMDDEISEVRHYKVTYRSLSEPTPWLTARLAAAAEPDVPLAFRFAAEQPGSEKPR